MNSLHYNIAGHDIAIETPDAAATEALLPNFEPFRVRVVTAPQPLKKLPVSLYPVGFKPVAAY